MLQFVFRQVDFNGLQGLAKAAMFRLMKLRPPHGWPPVWWELGIVTLAPKLQTGSTSSLPPLNHINLSSSAQAI